MLTLNPGQGFTGLGNHTTADAADTDNADNAYNEQQPLLFLAQ